jgi:hypothetical protein
MFSFEDFSEIGYFLELKKDNDFINGFTNILATASMRMDLY